MNTYLQKYKALNLPGKLIAIQVAIWSITQLLRLVRFLFTGYDCHWQDWLALHANLNEFVYTPWTLFTYFFVHANLGDNIFHLIFNMLWLWWFGQFFLRYHTGRQLLGTYLLGGLFAGVFYLLCFNLFPYLHAITYASANLNVAVVGASGAIFALVAAVAMRQPDEALYLNFFVRVVPVKMKWFALAALAINLMNLAGGENIGGIVCHLGGMLFGVVFGFLERKGIDLTRHFNLLCDWVADLFKPKPRMTATRGGKRPVYHDREKDHDYNRRKKEQQERIDAILDKISKSGYDGLTAEEKAMLFDASNRKK